MGLTILFGAVTVAEFLWLVYDKIVLRAHRKHLNAAIEGLRGIRASLTEEIEREEV